MGMDVKVRKWMREVVKKNKIIKKKNYRLNESSYCNHKDLQLMPCHM